MRTDTEDSRVHAHHPRHGVKIFHNVSSNCEIVFKNHQKVQVVCCCRATDACNERKLNWYDIAGYSWKTNVTKLQAPGFYMNYSNESTSKIAFKSNKADEEGVRGSFLNPFLPRNA